MAVELSGIPFQHTAARRRLGAMRVVACIYADSVSTHSRPKAAGNIPQL